MLDKFDIVGLWQKPLQMGLRIICHYPIVTFYAGIYGCIFRAIECPPSTVKICPVIHEDSSVARKRAVDA